MTIPTCADKRHQARPIVDIYVLRDTLGRCLYVGQTTQLTKRLAKHRRTQPWWLQVASVHVEQIPMDESMSRTPALIREAQLMEELQPVHSRPTPEIAALAAHR